MVIENKRIHILGASGAGVTTLGRTLADALAIPHHDTDDYYWLPTNPPYTQSRSVPERIHLMEEIFLGRPSWILSGSLTGWGDRLIKYFDYVIFINTPTEVRLQRLQKRELRRYGSQEKEFTRQSQQFLEWAAKYDVGDESMRSLVNHTVWLDDLRQPVIRLDGTESPSLLTRTVLDKISVIIGRSC